ncbi:hypothetical protein [Dyella tabacisoli]|nr:hypothetical protein [Dyella tabacisoli]
MKIQILAIASAALAVAGLPCLGAAKAKGDPLCSPLRAFVASVKKGESRTLEFHTSWGSDFKDSSSQGYVFAAKRCTFSSYEPARSVCDYLMDHGAIEFSGNNAKDVIVCLAPATQFSSRVSLDRVDVSFYYGTESRGSNIEVSFAEDSKIGGHGADGDS